MTKFLLSYIAAMVTILVFWNGYQDYPSVTGFYDHTVACKNTP